MKMCQAHWDELKQAIKDRGLEKFIAPNGEEATRRMSAGLVGRGYDEKKDFEPLLRAHFNIVSHALQVAGLNIMTTNEDGTDRCPLCFLIGSCPCGRGDECEYKKWIGFASDGQLEDARKIGLLAEG